MSPLGERLNPCGPVIDAGAAARALERLGEAADAGGWRPVLDAAWPALAPVFAASPYLFGLARRWPERLREMLEADPDAGLAVLLAETDALDGGAEAVKAPLRRLKARLHLLTALCDLGGVWDLDQVTAALSAFADASVQAALSAVAQDLRARGRLISTPEDAAGPVPLAERLRPRRDLTISPWKPSLAPM